MINVKIRTIPHVRLADISLPRELCGTRPQSTSNLSALGKVATLLS